MSGEHHIPAPAACKCTEVVGGPSCTPHQAGGGVWHLVLLSSGTVLIFLVNTPYVVGRGVSLFHLPHVSSRSPSGQRAVACLQTQCGHRHPSPSRHNSGECPSTSVAATSRLTARTRSEINSDVCRFEAELAFSNNLSGRILVPTLRRYRCCFLFGSFGGGMGYSQL